MKSIKQAYREFLNTALGSDAYRRFKRILYSSQDSLVQMLDTQILEVLPSAQHSIVRVCDIGAGDGERAMRILAFLNAKFHNRFELDLVEQSSHYVRRARRRRPRRFCKLRVLHAFFERTALPRSHYDLILLIHSIFALENGKAIGKVLSLRKPNGKVVVVSNAPNSFLGGLKSLMDTDFEDKRYEIDDLQRSLRKSGIRYYTWSFETQWAIERRNWKRSTDTILDWISLGRYRSFDRQRKRRICAYIADKSKAEADRVMFREKEIVVVIPGVP